MTDEPQPPSVRGLLLGAVIGICTATGGVLPGAFAFALLAVVAGPHPLEPGDPPGHLTKAQFDALSVSAAVCVALIVSALLGRIIVRRWRGVLTGAGALVFALIAALGVALSPFARSDGAATLAALASAGLYGAAFLRPDAWLERDVPAS